MSRINLFKNHRIWLVAVLCLFVNVSLFSKNISVGTAFTIDNISYCVTSENEVAVYNAKGEIVKIPDQIVYNGNDYLVTAVIYKCIDDSNKTSWSGVSIVNFGKNIRKVDEYAFGYANKIEEIKLNEGLEEINDYAFSGLKNLRTINLPSNLKKIGKYAFNGCYEWRGAIVIPDGVTEISEYAFYGCCKIESVDCGKFVIKIGSSAFCGCYKLKNIVIRENVKEIGLFAFVSCNLVQIKVLSELPPNCDKETFVDPNYDSNIYTNATLYVPKGSKPWYYLGDVWKNFKNIEEKYTIGEKCKEPIISIVDNKINITCDTTIVR